MHTIIFEGIMTALTSISHNGGQSFGISTKLRREKYLLPDGSVEEIPVLSGNGLRGNLRDRGMAHMCRILGYGIQSNLNGELQNIQGLSKEAFYFLFSGGNLSAGKGLDISLARKICELIPLVGVLGGAVKSQLMPGKLKMGKAIPICVETIHLLPERFRPSNPQSIWDLTQEEFYTRKDDEKNEQLRTLITQKSENYLIPQSVHAKDSKSVPSTAVVEKNAPQQMMYFVETLIAGTNFYWKIVLDDPTELEFEAFLTMLAEFSRMPYVGGKSGVGLGEVSVKFDKWIRFDSRAEVVGEEISTPIGNLYSQHLQSKCELIKEFLKTL